jgi:phosphoglucosamine mutase
MRKLFGTDGIRGVANVFPMTTDLAMKVGLSTAYIFKREHRRPKIIIGKDTRLSGYMIETAITSDLFLLRP